MVRHSGNDPELVELATRNALAIAAGHCFVLFVREGFPVNVLNPIKAVPEVCTIYCATANPVEVLVAVTPRGRGVVGVVDGEPPLGVETEKTWPRDTTFCAPSATSSEELRANSAVRCATSIRDAACNAAFSSRLRSTRDRAPASPTSRVGLEPV